MHAGRLHLAKQSLSRASGIGERSSAEEITRWLSKGGDSATEIPRFWIQQIEVVSTSGLIDSRLGRPSESVLDVIESAELRAEAVLDLLDASLADDAVLLDHKQRMLVRACRRLICRRAHFDLLTGDVAGALVKFERASRIERRCGNAYLGGDAGRRYVQALLRSREEGLTNLEMASNIASWNLAQWRPGRTGRTGRISNDIVAAQTSMSTLLRAEGRYEDAAQLLNEVESHDFLKRGECTYFARSELILERCRLQIAIADDLSRTADELRTLVLQRVDSYHTVLANEARLLLAEIVGERERESLLREIGHSIASTGWRLRSVDVRLLREGKSPVRELIC